MVTWYDFWPNCPYHPFYINKRLTFWPSQKCSFFSRKSASSSLQVWCILQASPWENQGLECQCAHLAPPTTTNSHPPLLTACHLLHITKPYVCPGPQNISAWGVPHKPSDSWNSATILKASEVPCPTRREAGVPLWAKWHLLPACLDGEKPAVSSLAHGKTPGELP